MNELKRLYSLPKGVYAVHTNQRLFFIDISESNEHLAAKQALTLIQPNERIHQVSSSITTIYVPGV